MNPLVTFMSQDRIQALARGESLPEAVIGSALFADISGFTPLFERLAQQLGLQRSAEEMTRLISQVYESLIGQVDQQRGSVIDFVGDAITCWFEEDTFALRAATCALAMQGDMAAFTSIEVIPGVKAELAVKVGIATGPARRFVVGDPDIRQIDAAAGETIRQMSLAEGMAKKDEIVLSPSAVAVLQNAAKFSEFRSHPESKAEFAVLEALSGQVEANPWPEPPALKAEKIRPWVLAPLYERLSAGHGEILAELRPVVALFLRFTGIDYDRDHDAGDKLDAFIRRVQQITARSDGHLIQLTIGDKGSFLYIVFGALTAYDDDAIRAVRTAESLLTLSAEFQVINIQIGLASGPARTGIYGSSTRHSYGAIGKDVVLAARLMVAAPPGEMRCSHSIYRQTTGKVNLESLPSVRVKGRADLVQVYRPANNKPVSITHQQSKIMGRQHEMAVIERLLTEVQEGVSKVLVIQGEAGIGKSRLVDQLVQTIRERGLAGLIGTGHSIEQQTPYRVWRDILTAYFRLGEVEYVDEQRARVKTVVGQIVSEHAQRLPVLNDILGLDIPENALTQSLDATLRRQNVSLLVTALLKAWAVEHPLILIFEDAHWIDSLSWQLMLEITRLLSLSKAPFLFVLVHRSLEEANPGQKVLPGLRDLNLVEALPLPELVPQDIAALIADRLGVPLGNLPPELVKLVQVRAHGNPFFAEELLIHLQDTGAIQISASSCHIVGDLGTAGYAIPDTLHGLILSRIDRLPPERQLVLKVAAVLGRAFVFSPLFYTLNRFVATLEPVLKEHLSSLQHAEFTFLEAIEPDLTYLFKHIITQEAAYQTLLFAQRRDLHRMVAEWYETRPEVHILFPLLAYHYRYAEVIEKEIYYLKLAGESAEKAYANEAAIGFYSRLLILIPPQEQTEIFLKRGKIYELIGQWEEAEADYRAGLGQAGQDMATSASAQLVLGKLSRMRGDYPAALAWLEESRERYILLDNEIGQMQVLIEKGVVLHSQGKYVEASGSFNEGLALARALHDQTGIAQALNHLGNVAERLGELNEARALYTECLALRRAMEDKKGVAETLQNLGLVEVWQSHSESEALYEESLALRREMGDKQGVANMLNNLGNVALGRSEYSRARTFYEESLALRRQMGDKKGIASSLNNLGIVMENQGKYAGARQAFEECLIMNRQMGDQWGIAMPLTNLGSLGLLQEDTDAALKFFEEALELWRNLGVKQGAVIVLGNLGHLLPTLGEYTAARVRLEEGLKLSQEMGDKQNNIFIRLGFGVLEITQNNWVKAHEHILVALKGYQETGEKQALISCLIGLAGVALQKGDPLYAAQLLGLVAASLATLHCTVSGYIFLFHKQILAEVRQALSESDFQTAWHLGETWLLDEVVNQALKQAE